MDDLIAHGAKFAWFFHYMPVGSNAPTELLPAPEQREQMYCPIRKYRESKPIFTIDFQNDGEYVGGCCDRNCFLDPRRRVFVQGVCGAQMTGNTAG